MKKGVAYTLLLSCNEKLQRHLTVRSVFTSAILIRVLFLVYGEWQDFNFAVKFTDIDYHVFSDAAQHVVDGRSPYLRPTYRYTPLLAILLTLNHYLFFSFGKVLFVLCDLGVGLLIHQVLCLRGVTRYKRVVSISLWLLNPLTAAVSSRGNAESLIAVLVLLTLYLVLCKRLYLSAIFFGLSVHMKVFPIIYSLPLFLFIDEDYATDTNLGRSELVSRNVLWRFFTPQRLKFVFGSVGTFACVTASFYMLYGDEFIQEAYLYHITRRDTRHNFSAYFYVLYLIQDSWLSLPVGILAFVPQAVLLLATSLLLYKDITLCSFVQTFVFVSFNKVCTSQYFLWYLCLLPLVTPFSDLGVPKALRIILLWFSGQVMWLLPAYLLEFQGYNTFILMWSAGLVFFLINVSILVALLKSLTLTPVFSQGSILQTQKLLSKLK